MRASKTFLAGTVATAFAMGELFARSVAVPPAPIWVTLFLGVLMLAIAVAIDDFSETP